MATEAQSKTAGVLEMLGLTPEPSEVTGGDMVYLVDQAFADRVAKMAKDGSRLVVGSDGEINVQ